MHRYTTVPTYAEHLTAGLIDDLPETLDLVYVDRDDRLTDEQVGHLLAGDYDSLSESMYEWTSDSQYDSVRYEWDRVLGDLPEADADLLGDDSGAAFEEFQQACWDRDRSDPVRDLAAGNGGVMVRYHLGHSVDPVGFGPEDAYDEEAREIGRAAGVCRSLNADALRELVTEASYGGELCVLRRTDLSEFLHPRPTSVTFTDPTLLVYDGLNGSGHAVTVKGTVTVDLTDDNVRHDAGPYSWSDDVACVWHGHDDFNGPATFTRNED